MDLRGRYLRHPKTYPLPDDLAIDEDLTQSRLGYPATRISPGSLKKVSCHCARCPAVFDRMRRRVLPGALCASCAHTLDGMKLGDAKVTAHCGTCGRGFQRRRKNLTTPPCCASCTKTAWWAARSRGDFPDVTSVLNDDATRLRFGYVASLLPPTSTKKVVGTCTQCHQPFVRIRRNVNANTRCRTCCGRSAQGASAIAKHHATLLARYGVTGYPANPAGFGKAEEELATLVQTWTGAPVVRQLALHGGQRLDIVVPSRELAIEYCGLHWHHELSRTPRDRHYHHDRMRLAATRGLRLVTLFEDEWLRRRHASEGLLRAALGDHATRLGARTCDLVELAPGVARAFMEREHLQGGSHRATYAVGLYAGTALVAAATLAPHHRASTPGVLVLDRLCFASGVQVLGGASRLLHALTSWAKAQGATRLVTWSDNRWSAGGVYARIGFHLAAELPPDYGYVLVAKPRERLSKQSQRKSRTGCPPDTTEHAWALAHGLARIWDCGHKRWELSL